MNSDNTTIKLTRVTKERLDKLKEYKRESYEEILQKIMALLNLLRFNPEKSRARLLSLDRRNKVLRQISKPKDKTESKAKVVES